MAAEAVAKVLHALPQQRPARQPERLLGVLSKEVDDVLDGSALNLLVRLALQALRHVLGEVRREGLSSGGA